MTIVVTPVAAPSYEGIIVPTEAATKNRDLAIRSSTNDPEKLHDFLVARALELGKYEGACEGKTEWGCGFFCTEDPTLDYSALAFDVDAQNAIWLALSQFEVFWNTGFTVKLQSCVGKRGVRLNVTFPSPPRLPESVRCKDCGSFHSCPRT